MPVTVKEVFVDYDSIADAILERIESTLKININDMNRIRLKWDIGDSTIPDGSASPTKDLHVNGVTILFEKD